MRARLCPRSQNQTLQRKLAEYLRSAKKSDETKEAEKSVTDQEQRYYKCLAQVTGRMMMISTGS